MGAAAIDDAIAWCLLILAISIANAGDLLVACWVFLSVVCFGLGLFFVIRPPLEMIVEYIEKWAQNLKIENKLAAARGLQNNLFAFTICLMFMAAWTTALLGVHAIFGAFLFGNFSCHSH